MRFPIIRKAAVNCPETAHNKMIVGTDITAKVKVKTDHVRKDGTCAVYIQCFAKGEQIRMPTGLSVRPEHWDHENVRFNRKHPHYKDHNLIIEDMLQRIHEMRVKSRLGHLSISPDVIREFVLQSTLTIDFLEYMEWKIKGRVSEIAYNTYRHHRSTFLQLKQFKDPIPFAQINNQLIFKWRDQMKAHGKSKNTIANKIKILKYYMNRAKEDGIHFDFPKRALVVSEERGKRTALTKEELRKTMELYQTGDLVPGMRSTLRCFLFSCFTGLRYGDIAAFDHEHIVGQYIIVTPQKTRKSSGRHLKIPINNLAESLLDRNAEKPLGEVITNQKMNLNLKKLEAYLGTSSKITFHVSRHTFATIFLELGGAVEVLKELMGHSKLELTMVYTHIVDKRKDEQISNFNNLL